ncbi:MAG: TIGR03619 family F420-dependent LLM class oxidoreductase [Myxococcota bacterium]|nr:TIGR03619 family F420-dependent LLM class oxidoreductase [Myxococcales bacterium]
MKYAIQLPTDRVDAPDEFLSARALAEIGACVEQAGFDSCYVTDHPAPTDDWLAGGGHQTLDPFVALSFVAAATHRILLQLHVLIAAYRNPFLSAKAIATLDVLSGGRVIAGVAAGYLEGEFDALGVAFATRNERTDERIREMQRIWAGGSIELDGHDFRARAITTLPLPAQRPHPPIWIGGNSRRAIRRAAELGDAWLPFPTPKPMAERVRTAVVASLDDLRERIAYLRACEKEFGRAQPLDVMFVPFGMRMNSPHPVDPVRFAETSAELAELGVTWLTITPPLGTRADYCAWVRRFGEDVIARER